MAVQPQHQCPIHNLTDQEFAQLLLRNIEQMCSSDSDAGELAASMDLFAGTSEHDEDEIDDLLICELNRIIGEWEQFGDQQDTECQEICSMKQLEC